MSKRGKWALESAAFDFPCALLLEKARAAVEVDAGHGEDADDKK